MILKKKLKLCKICQKEITKPLTGLGLSKYCSVKCAKTKKTKLGQALISSSKEVLEDFKSSKKRFKKLDSNIKLKAGTKLDKQVFDRDPKYLTMVRSLGCIVCGSKENIHAHHTGSAGKGVKASDYTVVGLCPNHHTGNKGVHLLGVDTFKKEFGINFEKIINNYLMIYIRILKNV